jgi:xylan 1,4-beta-xylosidase
VSATITTSLPRLSNGIPEYKFITLFYLIYTDVKRYGRTTTAGASGASLRDLHNYLVTSEKIDGEWSDPIFLNSSGFDPSLFHDDDGRKYLLNMLWDFRPGNNRFAGIELQEYSAEQGKLVGEREVIFKGTSIGLTEAPHIYKRNNYYYLLTAEGGTGWGHAVTLARSRNLRGPYELHPDTYILTSRDRPDAKLQRAGHADLVETQNGDTYMVHLCGRPIGNRGRCTLGRETAIQKMRWRDDDWLVTDDEEPVPRVEVAGPNLPLHEFPQSSARDDFDEPELSIDFQWLRSPWPHELFSLTERPGHLRLYGRETMGSQFRQSLVARRQQSHCYGAITSLQFSPEDFQQMAGLICYYNGAKFHYFYVSYDDLLGKHLRVMSALPDSVQTDAFTAPLPITANGAVELRVEVDFERLRFAFRTNTQQWTWLPEVFDASILSDEASAPGQPNFTGAFVGMCCQDGSGQCRPADFDYFEYIERDFKPHVEGV